MTRRLSVRLALLATLVLVGYGGAVRAAFVQDDHIGVERNPVVNGSAPIFQAFSRDFWGQSPSVVRTYRPVAVLSEALEWRLSGGSPAFMHGVSVLLHAALVVVLYLVGRTIVSDGVAWMGAALMAVLAAPSEVPLTIVGQGDILAGISLVLGLAAHRRRGRSGIVAAAICYALAIACKESAILGPLAWVLFDVVLPAKDRRPWLNQVPAYALAAGVMMLLRWHAIGLVSPAVSNLNNPFVGASALSRILGAARVFANLYVGSLIDPFEWQYDCSFAACLPGSAADPWSWAGLALALVVLVGPFLAWRRAPAVAAGLGWFAIFFAPTSNFFVLSVAAYGGRWLYLPLPGLCLAGAAGLMALRSRALSWSIGALVVAINVVALQVRQAAWRSELSLFRSGLEHGAGSAVVQRNLAEALLQSGDVAEALDHARRAVEIVPDYPLGRETLALSFDLSGKTAEAQAQFEEALKISRLKSTYMFYATFLARHGDLPRARDVAHAGLAQPGQNSPEFVRLEKQLAEDPGAKP